MPQAGFEPTNPTSERPQTYALDRAATGTGIEILYKQYNVAFHCVFESLRSGIHVSLNLWFKPS